MEWKLTNHVVMANGMREFLDSAGFEDWVQGFVFKVRGLADSGWIESLELLKAWGLCAVLNQGFNVSALKSRVEGFEVSGLSQLKGLGLRFKGS